MATATTPQTDVWIDQMINLNSRLSSLFSEVISVVLRVGNDRERRLKAIVNNVVAIFHNARTILLENAHL